MKHNFALKSMLVFGVQLVLASIPSWGTEVHCAAVSDDQTTFHAREDHRYSPLRSFRMARGVVDAELERLSGVLVEVYDHPELASVEPGLDRVGQHRIAACITSADGRFSFKLSPGKYVLRFSKEGGWDWTTFFIKVRRLSIHRNLTVPMHPAT
jgi:hypothetical protein